MIKDDPNAIKDLPRYMQNPKLKAANANMPLTLEQLAELDKCMDDPIYFIENYCWIISKDKGFCQFKLEEYQKRMVDVLHNNTRVLSMLSRQSGKTITNAAYALHYVIFNPDKTVAVLAHKLSGAKELLDRLKKMYEELPLWLQVGVIEWNKTSIELGNRGKVFCGATTSSSVRGKSVNALILDEFAFIPKNQADEFFESVFPTISNAPDSKISIFSTPKGMNHFYKMWIEATEGIVNDDGVLVKSEYTPFSILWNEVPGRDDTFKKKIVDTHGEDFWEQEYCCSFRGSIGTLLPARVLNEIVVKTPVSQNEFLKIYEQPIDGHTYIATVDVARGAGGDYSVVTISDITQLPYKQVAVYRNNELSYLLLSGVTVEIAKKYNEAYILIELNDNGESVADSIVYDYEYDNVLTTGEKKGKIVLGSWVNSKNGVRTTKTTKRQGCSLLKALVSEKQYIINDYDTLQEASNFAAKGGSYEATSGSTDDIMMTLVIFAWASGQEFFTELSNSSFKARYVDESHAQMMHDLLPIGAFEGYDEDEFDSSIYGH